MVDIHVIARKQGRSQNNLITSGIKRNSNLYLQYLKLTTSLCKNLMRDYFHLEMISSLVDLVVRTKQLKDLAIKLVKLFLMI